MINAMESFSHGLLKGLEVGNPFGVSQMRFLAAWIYLRKA